jgi:uncharacterized protein YheU (UPF0270 family)
MPEDRRDLAVDPAIRQDADDASDRDERMAVPASPVEIPWRALSPAAAAGIIDAFILREGTDYGAVEASHADKVAQVRAQLESGQVVISFDPATESVTLLHRAEWVRLEHGGITP